MCYNQEKYVREAIEGAFAQSYEQLDILISDDASVDGTFAIVQQMVAAYKGPHRVACSRNESNIGIAEHINKINRLAAGELILVAAGDDISFPERTEKLVAEYVSSGKKANYFYSSAREMAVDGSKGGIVVSPGANCADSLIHAALSPYPLAIGATQAWTKSLTNAFAPISPKVWAEDQILGFRGVLLGEIRFIDEPLVYYRVGSGISTQKKAFSFRRYFHGRWAGIQIFRQRAIDACHCKKYPLALLLAGKVGLLTLAIPIDPFISAVRKMLRR
jgi:glycosyltransferase involved in cell wall biosynthesis